MLERSPQSLSATIVQHKCPRRRPRISGQSLAKTKREPHELGHLAAHWVAGALIIDPPTIVQAVKIFSVSPALIHRALDDLEGTTIAQPEIDAIWSEMCDEEREDFVRTHLGEVWRLVDIVTTA
jgi:hypothetical protein